MAEDVEEVAPEASGAFGIGQRGDVGLVHEVGEVGRLGQDFHIQKRRGGLERDCLQRLSTVQAGRAVDVSRGQGEQEPPGETRQALPETTDQRQRPPAEDVVGPVDRLKQGFEVGQGPGLLGRRDQDQRV